MLNKNNSKKIRNYILEQYYIIDELFNELTEIEKNQILFDVVEAFDNKNVLDEISDNNIDFRRYQTVSKLSKIQIFTDYYRYKKISDKVYGSRFINSIPKINSYEDLDKYCKNPYTRHEMIEAVKEYGESTKLDRILLNKCLDIKDVKYLKSVNPFFEYDYNKYNINIDLDFIIKQIKKWQKFYPQDVSLSYDILSRFIFQLNYCRKEEAEKLLLELFDEKLSIYSSTDSAEETINIGNIRIGMRHLNIMLREYYDYNKKVLKYIKEDKNDK